MFHFLHTYLPDPVLISFGPIKIYWYGLFIVTGILAAIFVVFKLAEKYDLKKDIIIDSIFWLIIGGVIGARLYHIGLELPFYLQNPLSIFKVWQGGLAIHGGLIAGVAITWLFAKKNKLNFWLLAAIYAPGLALAQAIGRWGNYFNQELFGQPTNLPWGIPIDTAHRLSEFYNAQFFHPTFLYESIGNVLIFTTLLAFHVWIIGSIKRDDTRVTGYQLLVIGYLLLYSVLRFFLEFIRIDTTVEIFGLRWPQIVSLLIIGISLFYLYKKWPTIKPLIKA
jgi:phosphatidylglycerol:prolipoprotein diacylglycerol transferase